MTVGELNDATRTKFGIAADVSGVVITRCHQGFGRFRTGIQPGDDHRDRSGIGRHPKDVMDRIGGC